MTERYEVRRVGKYHAVFNARGERVSGAMHYDRALEVAASRTRKATLTLRPCLCCDAKFFSEGPGNRLCNRCRGRSDGGLTDHSTSAAGI